jgi:hypothetical protein
MGRDTKRVVLPAGPITMEGLTALFAERFQRPFLVESSPVIHIRDPAAGLFYELENVNELRDKSVLRIKTPGKSEY